MFPTNIRIKQTSLLPTWSDITRLNFQQFIHRFVNRAHNYNRIRFEDAFHLSDWIGINAVGFFLLSLLFLAAILYFTYLAFYIFFIFFFYCSLLLLFLIIFFLRWDRWQIRLTFPKALTVYIKRIYGWDHL